MGQYDSWIILIGLAGLAAAFYALSGANAPTLPETKLTPFTGLLGAPYTPEINTLIPGVTGAVHG